MWQRLEIGSPRRLRIAYGLLLCVFISFVYQNSLDSPFIFDDLTNIILNPAVQPESMGQLLDSLQPVAGLSYRPLASLTFALNYLSGELNVQGYHLINILIHILNALCLFGILCLLVQSMQGHEVPPAERDERQRDAIRLAFWGTVLWALSPVQVHAVTYIVQRMTSLSTLFYLLAIWFYLLYRNYRLSPGLAALLITTVFVAGMTCKEIMVTLPVSLFLLDRIMPSSDRSLRPWALIVAVLLVAGLGAFYLQGRIPDITQTYPGRDFSGLERLLTEGRVLWHYLSIWFMPLPTRLHMDYEVVVSRSLWQPLTTGLSLVAWIVLVGVVWWLRKRRPLFSFACLFFVIGSSIEASFLNLDLAFIHRLYLPSAFLMFGVLSLLSAERLKRSVLILWLLVALLSYGTLQRNQEWNNRAEFWSVDYDRGASHTRAILNHSIGLIESNNSALAIPQLQLILSGSLGRNRMLILNALGTAHFHTGSYTLAIETFEILHEDFGAMQEPLYYSGIAHGRNGETERMKEIADRLLLDDDESVYGHLLLADYLRSSGKVQQALSTLQVFITTHPRLPPDAMNNCRVYMADIYLELGEFEQAYDLYNQVIEKDPHQFLAWIQIYRMLKSSGDAENFQKVRAYLESKQIRLPEE